TDAVPDARRSSESSHCHGDARGRSHGDRAPCVSRRVHGGADRLRRMEPPVSDRSRQPHGRRSARCAPRAARTVHRQRHARRAGVSADVEVDKEPQVKARFRSVVAQGFSPASAALKGCATFVLTVAALAIGGAQSFEKRATDSRPPDHGDYSGQRHSPLTQITPANVSQLTLAWAFQTGQSASIKSTPIVVNGILYVSAPDQLWAIDARTARQVWQYRYPDNTGFHIGHRGVAVYKDSVFLTTPDAHLVALAARNGKVKWNVEIADAKKGYWSTNAPLLIRNHLLVGVAGDFDNLPGILTSVDPETGKTQWVYYSTPPPGTPGSTSGGATGGQMWMTGTYDPQLDLVYVGTGNPTPVLNGDARPGDNTWTNSIVALHPETGKMEWGFQTTPHDTHDWDAAEVPVLVDGLFD